MNGFFSGRRLFSGALPNPPEKRTADAVRMSRPESGASAWRSSWHDARAIGQRHRPLSPSVRRPQPRGHAAPEVDAREEQLGEGGTGPLVAGAEQVEQGLAAGVVEADGDRVGA